ncbi:MAG: alcohol dehydrogenase [Candidatus Auribacter fodinae]|jgi:NADPH:quinone reductase-like Zn-dependent oxidoreductase|uniref:Alcohol dehydrogenase n=1 Tax=Candidatus Auribacter fodinae TaxID=2093366 RepID=A0A3A4R6Y0_9BACT|nr:MAG: alcohol dehydrogenase [Candidatus Auribacter fodinae]
MKACFIKRYGDPSVINTGSLPDPVCSPDEVIIETKATALNHLDIWVRMGRPGNALTFPHILGSDLSGVIREIGLSVGELHNLRVGDEVIIYPGTYCGICSACRRGEHSLCTYYGLMGLTRQGTFSQYAAVPAANVLKKPEHLSFEESAAFPLTYLTAWRMLFTQGKLSPGQIVLIHGIGGGVALASLQLALSAGAHVIVTSSSDAKLEKASIIGAHATINYKEDTIADWIADYTESAGVDLIIDAVGAETMKSNLNIIKKGGTIVLCGVTTGPEAMLDLRSLYWKQIALHGSTMGSISELQQVLKTINTNAMKPVIDSIHTMDDVITATERMEKGKQFGKIILVP